MTAATLATSEKYWFNRGRSDCYEGRPYDDSECEGYEDLMSAYCSGWSIVKEENMHKVNDTLFDIEQMLEHAQHKLFLVTEMKGEIEGNMPSDDFDRYYEKAWFERAEKMKAQVEALMKQVEQDQIATMDEC